MDKRFWPFIAVGAVLFLVGMYLALTLGQKVQNADNIREKNVSNNAETSLSVQAGKKLSNNMCTGTGSKELTQLPMNQDDFAMILPYGLMIGGHVTPIDHQYFSPTVFNSPRDTYPVYAMADAKITEITPRTNDRGTEYRFVFTISCTFFYYYDLVTSLAPDIQVYYDKRQFGFEVKAGDLVGKIGGQTLDFAVWDTTKPLKNFINPETYEGEPWKIYTADPLEYYPADVKAKALAKYVRTQKPLSGRIDYDVDGKLQGNWFETGTKGYAGATGTTGGSSYWAGHLSIVPEYIDNSAIIVSFGNWNDGEAKQFAAKNPTDPTTVGAESGPVKYELYEYRYIKSDGSFWDSLTLYQDAKVKLNSTMAGCVMFQLTSARALKVEQFPGKTCGSVSAFTNSAKTYER